MGTVRKPEKAKLIVGLIYKNEDILKKVETLLSKKFGPIDKKNLEFSFTHSRYYEKELGDSLKRKFISFELLIELEKLWRIKFFTNSLEVRFSKNKKRTINIDPGYLELSKLILLTTKDYTHRIHLGKGIFAEVTLFFKDGSFHPWEHTYPDYKDTESIEFFNKTRKLLTKI